MINFLPLINMTFKEKLLAIVNLIIFLSLIFSLIFRNIIFILLGIILLIFLFYIYLFDEQNKINTNETLSNRNLGFYDNKICVKPSLDNPFMNPSIIDYNNNNNNIKACPFNKEEINTNINTYFKENVFKDINDIYERNFSERQFYTVPSTTIPNDRKSYQEWLYYRDKTCKENNGIQCYNNII
jgi:c-di-AMP phosphodiesterase-like protein